MTYEEVYDTFCEKIREDIGEDSAEYILALKPELLHALEKASPSIEAYKESGFPPEAVIPVFISGFVNGKNYGNGFK